MMGARLPFLCRKGEAKSIQQVQDKAGRFVSVLVSEEAMARETRTRTRASKEEGRFLHDSSATPIASSSAHPLFVCQESMSLDQLVVERLPSGDSEPQQLKSVFFL